MDGCVVLELHLSKTLKPPVLRCNCVNSSGKTGTTVAAAVAAATDDSAAGCASCYEVRQLYITLCLRKVSCSDY